MVSVGCPVDVVGCVWSVAQLGVASESELCLQICNKSVAGRICRLPKIISLSIFYQSSTQIMSSTLGKRKDREEERGDLRHTVS